jgi:hypothetical protein
MRTAMRGTMRFTVVHRDFLVNIAYHSFHIHHNVFVGFFCVNEASFYLLKIATFCDDCNIIFSQFIVFLSVYFSPLYSIFHALSILNFP